jgi:hypothetical protein
LANDGSLAILDLKNHKVTNYCIPYDNSIFPVWSPDSRQVLVWNYNGPINHLYLVDIIDQYAIQIAEDNAAMGWMAYP